MVLVHTKPNAHKGLDYDRILRSLGLYARPHLSACNAQADWLHHPKLAPKVNNRNKHYFGKIERRFGPDVIRLAEE